MPVLWSTLLNAYSDDDDSDSDDEDTSSILDEWDDIDSDEDSDSEDPFGSIGVQIVPPPLAPGCTAEQHYDTLAWQGVTKRRSYLLLMLTGAGWWP